MSSAQRLARPARHRRSAPSIVTWQSLGHCPVSAGSTSPRYFLRLLGLLAAGTIKLRTLSGVAPVTKRSGKSHVVVMRYASHVRLRNTVYHWARVAIQHD